MRPLAILSLGMLAAGVAFAPASAAVETYLDLGSSSSEKPSSMTAPPSSWIKISSFSFGIGRGVMVPGTSAHDPNGGPTSPMTQKKPLVDLGATKATPLPRYTMAAGPVRTAGPASVEGVDLTLPAGPAAQQLFQLAVTGRSLAQVRLLMFKPGARALVPVGVVTLHDVMVTSTQWKGELADRPSENVTLNYRAMQYEKPAGTPETTKNPGTPETTKNPGTPANWNIVTNKPI